MRVLLVVDVDNWAWAHKARAIKKYLADEFEEIDVITKKKLKQNMGLLGKHHSIHSFGWMEGKDFIKYKLTTGVSSLNYYYRHLKKAKKLMPKYEALTATCKLIYDDLEKRNLNKNIYLCENGVETEMFFPEPIRHDKFTVGFMGQPTTGGHSRGCESIDMHGYQHLLLPLVETFKDNKDIEFKILAKTFKNAIPHEKMPAWYNSLDVMIGTQMAIGTPNGLFEANACGIPGIQIACGAAPELITDGVNGYLLPRYSSKEEAFVRVAQIKGDILYLSKNRELCKEMGVKAREEIEKNWKWADRAKAWLPVLKNFRKRL